MKISRPAKITALCLAGSLLLWIVIPNGKVEQSEVPIKTEDTAAQEAVSPLELTLPSAATTPAVLTEKVEASQLASIQSAWLAPGQSAPTTPPQIIFGTAALPWELQLKEIKARTSDATLAAKAILGLLPYLPEEALEPAIEQAMEKLPTAAWRQVALPVLLNPQTHARVMSSLFTDLMERPASTSVPSLLEVAKAPAHPFTEFAVDNLKVFLGENFDPKTADWTALLQKTSESPPAELAPQ